MAEIISEFDNCATGAVNAAYERYVFNSHNHRPDESSESVVRHLAKSCNYCDACAGSLIRDRIVQGIRSVSTQEALLKDSELNINMP